MSDMFVGAGNRPFLPWSYRQVPRLLGTVGDDGVGVNSGLRKGELLPVLFGYFLPESEATYGPEADRIFDGVYFNVTEFLEPNTERISEASDSTPSSPYDHVRAELLLIFWIGFSDEFLHASNDGFDDRIACDRNAICDVE